jgi:hypothetical protein
MSLFDDFCKIDDFVKIDKMPHPVNQDSDKSAFLQKTSILTKWHFWSFLRVLPANHTRIHVKNAQFVFHHFLKMDQFLRCLTHVSDNRERAEPDSCIFLVMLRTSLMPARRGKYCIFTIKIDAYFHFWSILQAVWYTSYTNFWYILI